MLPLPQDHDVDLISVDGFFFVGREPERNFVSPEICNNARKVQFLIQECQNVITQLHIKINYKFRRQVLHEGILLEEVNCDPILDGHYHAIFIISYFISCELNIFEFMGRKSCWERRGVVLLLLSLAFKWGPICLRHMQPKLVQTKYKSQQLMCN
jgi:hypothetical protein